MELSPIFKQDAKNSIFALCTLQFPNVGGFPPVPTPPLPQPPQHKLSLYTFQIKPIEAR